MHPSWTLGRALVPAKGNVNEMHQWKLKPNGKAVPRRIVRPLSTPELHSPVEVKKREVFYNRIRKILGSDVPKPSEEEVKEIFIEIEDEQEEPHAFPDAEHPTDS